jgi:hypothetical protein
MEGVERELVTRNPRGLERRQPAEAVTQLLDTRAFAPCSRNSPPVEAKLDPGEVATTGRDPAKSVHAATVPEGTSLNRVGSGMQRVEDESRRARSDRRVWTQGRGCPAAY